ncbi:MAG: stage II sporulation protein M [Pseudomonadota bacterium]
MNQSLRSLRFRDENEQTWKRLEALIGKVERRGAGGLSAEEAIELPRLYRATLSSLSVARETLLERATLQYLDALVARGYLAVYTEHKHPFEAISEFFSTAWSRSVRAIGWETLTATVIFFAGATAAYALVAGDADWFFSFVNRAFAAGRTPEATAESLRVGLYTPADASRLSIFAAELFSNNTGVALLAFALGFAFGVPTAFLLFYNGALLGAMMYVYASKGLAFGFTGWLLIHGVTELLAIVLAGAAGLRIGRAVAFPGKLTRLGSARRAGQDTAPAMIGVCLMLVLAAILESFGRELIISDTVRYSIAVTSGLFWLIYFVVPGRRGKVATL